MISDLLLKIIDTLYSCFIILWDFHKRVANIVPESICNSIFWLVLPCKQAFKIAAEGRECKNDAKATYFRFHLHLCGRKNIYEFLTHFGLIILVLLFLIILNHDKQVQKIAFYFFGLVRCN